MKKRTKIMAFFIPLILLTIYFITCASIYINDINTTKMDMKAEYNQCQFTINNSENISMDYINYCKNLNYQIDNYIGSNFYVMLSELIVRFFNPLCYVMFLFIVAPALIWLNKIFKNKIHIYYFEKMSIRNFIKKMLKESYIYVLILPTSLILLFLYCMLFTNLNFDTTIVEYTLWSANSMRYVSLFLFIYILQSILFAMTYVNIGLIISRKNYNYFITVISSYLLFISIELFMEIFIRKILISLTNIKFLFLISISNIFYFNDSFGLFEILIFPALSFMITFLIVINRYKNKEQIIIDCDIKQ